MSNESAGSKKLHILIEKLHSKTISGDVEWQPTSIPDRYVLQLPQTGIAIRETEQTPRLTDLLVKDAEDLANVKGASDPEKGYELTILNGRNKEVESFNIFKSRSKKLYDNIEEIFQYASTGFSNANRAIDAVINDLESEDKEGSFEPKGDLPF